MAWRLARSLDVLRAKLNALSPNRSKISDGTIGDAAHSSRTSDHNPDGQGRVCGMDITHDPAHGIDSEVLANALLASRDPRIKYVISNRKIASGAGGPQPWVWRPYPGKNPHNHHVHISVTQAGADDKSPWDLDLKVKPREATRPVSKPEFPVLVLGNKGPDVERLQKLLKIPADSDFGPRTKAAVVAFQKSKDIVPDGVVGPQTWEKLGAKPAAQPASTQRLVAATSAQPKPEPPPATPQDGEKPDVFLVDGGKKDETTVVVVPHPDNPPQPPAPPTSKSGFLAIGAIIVTLIGGALKYFGYGG
jgi:hypothetical protein